MRATSRFQWLAGLLLSAFAASSGAETATSAELSAWNRTITTFRATVWDIPPAQRAANARTRIAALPNSEVLPVSVQPAAVAGTTGFLVAAGDHVLFGLVAEDLDPEAGQSLEQAAAQASARVSEVLAARAAQRDLPALLRGIGLSLAALAVFAGGFWLTIRLRRAAIGRILKAVGSQRLSIGGLDLLPTLATVERATFRVLSWIVVFGLAFACVTFIFHQFPLTAPIGESLGGYVAEKLADAGRTAALALPSLFAVAGVLIVTRAISLWVARMLVEIEHGLREVTWLAQEQAKATRRIASGAVWMLGIATAYPLLPWSGSIAFQGMSVLLGLAVSFASGGLINHWVSGLMLLYARSFRVGEFVAVGGVEGTVMEMGALATKLRTMRREVVTIPNGAMATEQVVNYTRLAAEQGALLSISLAIGYDVPRQRVRDLLLEAAATEGVASDPPPRLLVWELADFHVRYQFHVRLDLGRDRIAMRDVLNARILDAFNAAGVQIMTPHFENQPPRPVIAPLDSGRTS